MIAQRFAADLFFFFFVSILRERIQRWHISHLPFQITAFFVTVFRKQRQSLCQAYAWVSDVNRVFKKRKWMA